MIETRLSPAEQSALALAARGRGWKPSDDGPWWIQIPFAKILVVRSLLKRGLIVKGAIRGVYYTADNPNRHWNPYGNAGSKG